MNLMHKLPSEAYNGEEHVRIFQDAIDVQVSDVQAARDDFKLQCSPITATWGLANYEREVGIPVDEDKPIEQRRSMYIAKLRGVGTTTTAVIKNIAKSFYNGEVEVIEHKREFWLEIIFLSLLGIPPNYEDLKSAIDEVIPAHMEPVYVVIWNIHDILRQLTHDELSRYTHDELRTIRIHPNHHNVLIEFTQDELAAFTHRRLMLEVLEHELINQISQTNLTVGYRLL